METRWAQVPEMAKAEFVSPEVKSAGCAVPTKKTQGEDLTVPQSHC